ncbi:MAG: hypothetical protein ABI765_15050 [Gemmatimonadota bacterium]
MIRRSLYRGRQIRMLATALVIALSARTAHAQLALSVFGGTSFSLPTPLTISQSGYPDLHFTAQFRTKPFYETYYYAGRLALWGKHNSAWIFDYTHHKLYLTNPPPEVQTFRITFGFNQFAFGRAFYRHGLIWSLAAGPVVANPYSVIRGQLRAHSGGLGNLGYLLSGATLQGGLSKQFRVLDRFFLVADSRVSFSYARVPVANGHATVPNVALHLHFGVGIGGPRHWGTDS